MNNFTLLIQFTTKLTVKRAISRYRTNPVSYPVKVSNMPNTK